MTVPTHATPHSQQGTTAADGVATLDAPDSVSEVVDGIASDLPDRVETWVNEGGAGDDPAR